MGEWGPSVNKCRKAHQMGGGLRPAVLVLAYAPKASVALDLPILVQAEPNLSLRMASRGW